MFGIINKKARMNYRKSYDSNECTCYYATNGYVYGPNNTQNSGFSTG